jgi:glycosyltransferase involved in cell wall biosynthesis
MVDFTIITINFNNLQGLQNTFKSVFNQIFENFQFIVIDGGSNDGSLALIEQSSEKISYWISESDNGVYHAMNKGLAKATGEYCIFLNSGDYFNDEFVLENVYNILDHESDLIYGLIQWENSGEFWNPRKDILDFEMVYNSLIPHQAAFFRTQTIKKMGGYIENFLVVSDWSLILKIIHEKHKTQKIEIVVSICEEQGISAKHEKLAKKERKIFLFKYSLILMLKGFLFKLKLQLKPN